VRKVAEFDNDAAFESVNEPGQWIAYNCMDFRVKVTAYPLRTAPEGGVSCLRH
jgi:hypothetical protein